MGTHPNDQPVESHDVDLDGVSELVGSEFKMPRLYLVTSALLSLITVGLSVASMVLAWETRGREQDVTRRANAASEILCRIAEVRSEHTPETATERALKIELADVGDRCNVDGGDVGAF